MSGPEYDADGDLRLRSPSLPPNTPYFPARTEVENLPDRSSSPAIKRPASELDDDDDRALGREDSLLGGGSPLRTVTVPLADSMQPTVDHARNHTEGSPREDSRRQGSLGVDETEHAQDLSERSTNGESETLESSVLFSSRDNASSTSDSLSSSAIKPFSRDAHDTSGTQAEPRPDVPPIDDQIAKITELSMRLLTEGDKGYVVSCRWVERVKSRASERHRGGIRKTEDAVGEVGPVDNSDIILQASVPGAPGLRDEAGEPFVPLKRGLIMGDDFDVFPEDAWQLIVQWYRVAPSTPPIARFVHNTNPEGDSGMENLQYEIYPPMFTVLKLRNEKGDKVQQGSEERSERVLASRSEPFNRFLKRAKDIVGIPLTSKVRVWRIIGTPEPHKSNGVLTPAPSRSNSPVPTAAAASGTSSPKRDLKLDDFLALEEGTQREVLEAQDQTGNENYNGRMKLTLAGLNQDETIILEERVRGSAGGDWISEAPRSVINDAGVAISVTKDGNTAALNKANGKANSVSGRPNPAVSTGGMMTRGRLQKNGRSIGTCGLSNLGNTCYMNSALQCVRSVEELTQYFRLDRYKAELNPSNPLSHNGDVARSYATLLDQMYAPTCPASIAPRAFKHTIGRYGPSFSGYGQQDSQEFLGFLLDGLQEDLNRIQKKPYIEKPDSTDEMVSNPAALRALADKCWEIYKARNDSVVVDLFAGTYKSTLVCPACDKVSITFDPFTNLTLQIPIENVWSKEVCYYPLDQRPFRMGVDIDKNGSIKALKEFVGKRVGVDPRRLHAAEIFKRKIFKVYEDDNSASELIQQGDKVGIFELDVIPTNWPPPQKKPQKGRSMFLSYGQSEDEDDIPGWDSPLAEKLLVPVYHRVPADSSSHFASSSVVCEPSYLVFTREEARDYDSILRKILRMVATMTTYDIFQSDDDVFSTTPEDGDMVVTTSDDADSSAETHTKTHSVEGEEDLVAVSITDPGDASQTHESTPTRTRQHQSRGRRAQVRMLEPGSDIPELLRNLFHIRIFRQAGDLVPSGWSADLEHDYDLVLMESRLPDDDSDGASSEVAETYYMPGDDATSEESDADQPGNERNVFRISNPESESEFESGSDQMPHRTLLSRKKTRGIRSASRSVRGIRRKGVNPKYTYSRKGQYFGADSPAEPTDDGPLIRLGEGIVLDWDEHAFSTLFGGSHAPDDMRGTGTWDHTELLADEELQQKRRQRVKRRQTGVSLGDCLDEFGKVEILSENDAWYCPRCKEFRRASKKFELWKAPDILVIHLKRFSASRGLRDKIDVLVDFPIEGLDLEERIGLKEEGKSAVYDLFAVDNHFGGLGGGHYTAMAKNFVDGSWYDYNDTMTSKRNPEQAITSAAYLLFYRRRSDRPLGGRFFEDVIEEAYHQKESQPSSRATSPAGDGQRLDDSFRVGSSSALLGVGAVRQEANDPASGRVGIGPDEDDLPSYSRLYPNGAHLASDGQAADKMDVDEGIDTSYPLDQTGPFAGDSGWGFDNHQSGMRLSILAPPGSSDEDLMDGASDKAADGSSGNLSDRGDRMAEFADDDDIGGLADSLSNTPNPRSLSESPVEEIELPLGSVEMESLHVKAPEVEEEDDGPVAEVHINDNEEETIKSS